MSRIMNKIYWAIDGLMLTVLGLSFIWGISGYVLGLLPDKCLEISANVIGMLFLLGFFVWAVVVGIEGVAVFLRKHTGRISL